MVDGNQQIIVLFLSSTYHLDDLHCFLVLANLGCLEGLEIPESKQDNKINSNVPSWRLFLKVLNVSLNAHKRT